MRGGPGSPEGRGGAAGPGQPLLSMAEGVPAAQWKELSIGHLNRPHATGKKEAFLYLRCLSVLIQHYGVTP